MDSSWLNNVDATKRVKELLVQAGLPLEIVVAKICQQFSVVTSTQNKDYRVLNEKIVYQTDDHDGTIREIDQCVIVEASVSMASYVDFQLFLFIPIECKHRDNVEIFGFPSRNYHSSAVTHPVLSYLVGANLINALGQHPPLITAVEPLSEICLLEITNGSTPKKVFDENLFYKSGMALYDYIANNSAIFARPFKENLVDKLGLFGQFDRYVSLRGKYSNSLVYSVADKWDQNVFQEFNTNFTTSRVGDGAGVRINHGIPLFIYFPIICMDAPLHLVNLNSEGNIEGFSPKKSLSMALRYPWSSEVKPCLVKSSMESLLTITNTNHLEFVLQEALEQ